MNKIEIGERIKEKMDEAAVGPVFCAQKLNLTNDAVFRWRRGKTIPKGENLVRLSTLINTTPGYILTGRVPQLYDNVVGLDYKGWAADKQTIINHERIIAQLNKELKDCRNIIDYARKNCTHKTCPIIHLLDRIPA